MINKFFNKKKVTIDDFLTLIDDDEFLDSINENNENYKITNGQYLFRLLNRNNEDYQLMMIKKYCSRSFMMKHKIKNMKNGFNEINQWFTEFFYTKDYNNEIIYIFDASNLSDHVFEILIENGLNLNYSYYRIFKDNKNIEVKTNLLDYVFQTNNLYLFNLFFKNGINIDIEILLMNYINFLSEQDSLTISKLVDNDMYCSLIESNGLEIIFENLSKKPKLYEKYAPIYLNKSFSQDKKRSKLIFDQLYFIINRFHNKYPKENIIQLFKEILNDNDNIQTVIKNNCDILLKKILDNDLYELISEVIFFKELFKTHEEKMLRYIFDNKNYELLKIIINTIKLDQKNIDNLLFLSVTINDLQMGSVLIECGANPFYENPEYFGLTCLHVSSYLKQPKDIFKNLSKESIELTFDKYKNNF